MRFDELVGRRAEVALELLREGKFINYGGVGLRLGDGVLACSLFVNTPLEAIDSAAAERQFSIGKASVDRLLAEAKWASALAGRPQTWELLLDYYGEPVRLCRMDHTGELLWDRGWPRAAV